MHRFRTLFLPVALACSFGSHLPGEEKLTPGGYGEEASTPDILFRNARVIDGSGNPWFFADVAVTGDRISGVGDLAGAVADKVFEVDGLYLVPGFIDSHSHAYEGLVSPDRRTAHPLLAQGITTVILNPDGGGPVNLEEQREKLLVDGIGVNAALMIGHGALRARVVGRDDRPPTEEEMEEMRELVRKAMADGAYGVTSGLFYAPASFASTEEIIEICRAAAESGGVYSSHIRDESNYHMGLVASVDEVIEISRESGIPGIVTHIKALGPGVWGFSEAVIRRIERARESGLEIWADQYPYEASSTSLQAALIPGWAVDGGRSAFLERMKEPETRARIREEVAANLERRGGPGRIYISRFRERPSEIGKYLSDLAVEAGEDPVEFALSMLESGSPGMISFNMDSRDVEAFMRQPWTMTSSDGGLPSRLGPTHPRSYGSFPRKIRHYVREREVVDLASAIRSMSYLPAIVFRMQDRGVVRKGAYADLAVFDLESINDPATFDQPHQLSEGMVHVLVNGRFAIENGEFTGEKAGRVLRRREGN